MYRYNSGLGFENASWTLLRMNWWKFLNIFVNCQWTVFTVFLNLRIFLNFWKLFYTSFVLQSSRVPRVPDIGLFSSFAGLLYSNEVPSEPGFCTVRLFVHLFGVAPIHQYYIRLLLNWILIWSAQWTTSFDCIDGSKLGLKISVSFQHSKQKNEIG